MNILTPEIAHEVRRLATEATNKMQFEARDYKDCVDIFYDYAYRIDQMGGKFIWYRDKYGQEIFHVEAPEEVIC